MGRLRYSWVWISRALNSAESYILSVFKKAKGRHDQISVHGPDVVASHSALAASMYEVSERRASLSQIGSETSVLNKDWRWSWRFLPTPGRWWITSMLRASSSGFGPTPERRRSFGVSMAPQESMVLFLLNAFIVSLLLNAGFSCLRETES